MDCFELTGNPEVSWNLGRNFRLPTIRPELPQRLGERKGSRVRVLASSANMFVVILRDVIGMLLSRSPINETSHERRQSAVWKAACKQ